MHKKKGRGGDKQEVYTQGGRDLEIDPSQNSLELQPDCTVDCVYLLGGLFRPMPHIAGLRQK